MMGFSLNKIKISTGALDRAAFFTTFGAKLEIISNKYPQNIFTLRVPVWLVAYESMGGWVPYNKFCNERRKIKRMCRKMAGLPEYFTGNRDTGFKLGDIAVINPWNQKQITKKWQQLYDKARGIVK